MSDTLDPIAEAVLQPPETAPSTVLPAFRRRGRRPLGGQKIPFDDFPLALTALRLDPASEIPLYQQLFEGLRTAIRNGDLPSGTRLPTIRAVAAAFGLGRNTVLAAYQRLTDEGLVNARVGRGTEVAASVFLPAGQSPAASAAGPSAGDLAAGALDWLAGGQASPAHGGAFALATPDPALFPRTVFGRYLAEEARYHAATAGFGDADGGFPRLRQAIADLLRQMRGVQCDPEDIVITLGNGFSMALAARMIVTPQDPVWIEDPTSDAVADAFREAGATLHSMPVDDEGAVPPPEGAPARLIATASECQPVLGVQASEARREALIARARAAHAFVLENDSDWTFVFHGPLRRALQPRAPERVIYCGAFDQAIGRNVQAGFMVVPAALRRPFVEAAQRLELFPPLFVQAALARFIEDGQFLGHLKRVRLAYSARRAHFLRTCQRVLPQAQAVRAAGGLHAALVFGPGFDDATAAERAAAAGLAVMPLSRMYRSVTPQRGLLLGFGALPNTQIDGALARLAAAIGTPPVNLS